MSGFVRLLRRIKSAFYFGLGVDRLTFDFKKFVLMHVVYLISTSTTTVFVNTLLMRVSTDKDIALKYNIGLFAFIGISMLLAAFLMHKVTNKTILIIGVSMSMVTYLLVLIFMDTLDVIYPIVTLAHGTATGFYWIIYFDSLMKYSTDDTRDVAMSFMGVCGGFIGLVMPLVSGYTIGAFNNYTGYYIMFAVFLAAAIGAVYLVTRLKPEYPDYEKTKYLKLMKYIYTQKVWYFVIHMDFFKGIREGAFSFFLNVLLFSIVKSEALVGFNTFLVGTTSMLACVIASKIFRPNNRIRFMTISTFLLSIVTLTLFIKLNTITVLILSVANSMLGVFMLNPVSTTLYTVLESVPNAKEVKNETIAVTECYKNVGRILGVVFIMVMPNGNIWSVVSLTVLVLTQFITVIFAKITMNCVKKYQSEEKINA